MTITMSEAKIAQAADFIYSELSSPSAITREECDRMARLVQEMWQDTDASAQFLSITTADFNRAAAEDPTPASQAPLGGDLYGATKQENPYD